MSWGPETRYLVFTDRSREILHSNALSFKRVGGGVDCPARLRDRCVVLISATLGRQVCTICTTPIADCPGLPSREGKVGGHQNTCLRR
jgi:hypothetical protein